MISHDHPWTFKIVIAYHRCPHCGKIIESRQDYQKVDGHYQKNLSCPRCHVAFTETKVLSKQFGPLFKHPYIELDG